MGETGCQLEWVQMQMGGRLLDRWAVRVIAPHLSIDFGTVSYAELRGLWLVRLTPKGIGLTCPLLWAEYLTREKAMAQVGRWAAHHWRAVPAWEHPQRWGAE